MESLLACMFLSSPDHFSLPYQSHPFPSLAVRVVVVAVLLLDVITAVTVITIGILLVSGYEAVLIIIGGCGGQVNHRNIVVGLVRI